MTAPIVPPTGRGPASPDRREAARDYLTRLRQQGGTYRSIAAVAVLAPDTGEHNPARPPPSSR